MNSSDSINDLQLDNKYQSINSSNLILTKKLRGVSQIGSRYKLETNIKRKRSLLVMKAAEAVRARKNVIIDRTIFISEGLKL